MTSHAIGYANDKTVETLWTQLGLVGVATDKAVVGQHHIFIITSDTTDTTGG
jgi:hypothetical protein